MCCSIDLGKVHSVVSEFDPENKEIFTFENRESEKKETYYSQPKKKPENSIEKTTSRSLILKSGKDIDAEILRIQNKISAY